MAELTTIITTRNDLPGAYNAMAGLRIDGPHEVIIKPFKKKRTLNQNAVFHMWMNELSAYLIARGRPFATPEWCKDAMKYTFLGFKSDEFTNAVTGAVSTVMVLASTRKLSTGDMFRFMEQVLAWATDIGCLLTIPQSSEFFKLRSDQDR